MKDSKPPQTYDGAGPLGPLPPVASPRHPLPAEEKTDPRMLAAIERHAPQSSRVKDTIVAVGAVLGSVVVSIIFVDNRVQAQTDAGVKVHESRIANLEQQRQLDRGEVDSRFQRIEKNLQSTEDRTDRTERKVDALLERFNVPNPAPAPRDGGR